MNRPVCATALSENFGRVRQLSTFSTKDAQVNTISNISEYAYLFDFALFNKFPYFNDDPRNLTLFSTNSHRVKRICTCDKSQRCNAIRSLAHSRDNRVRCTCHVSRLTFLFASLFAFLPVLLSLSLTLRNFIANLCAVSTSLSLSPKGCWAPPSSFATVPMPSRYASLFAQWPFAKRFSDRLCNSLPDSFQPLSWRQSPSASRVPAGARSSDSARSCRLSD